MVFVFLLIVSFFDAALAVVATPKGGACLISAIQASTEAARKKARQVQEPPQPKIPLEQRELKDLRALRGEERSKLALLIKDKDADPLDRLMQRRALERVERVIENAEEVEATRKRQREVERGRSVMDEIIANTEKARREGTWARPAEVTASTEVAESVPRSDLALPPEFYQKLDSEGGRALVEHMIDPPRSGSRVWYRVTSDSDDWQQVTIVGMNKEKPGLVDVVVPGKDGGDGITIRTGWKNLGLTPGQKRAAEKAIERRIMRDRKQLLEETIRATEEGRFQAEVAADKLIKAVVAKANDPAVDAVDAKLAKLREDPNTFMSDEFFALLGEREERVLLATPLSRDADHYFEGVRVGDLYGALGEVRQNALRLGTGERSLIDKAERLIKKRDEVAKKYGVGRTIDKGEKELSELIKASKAVPEKARDRRIDVLRSRILKSTGQRYFGSGFFPRASRDTAAKLGFRDTDPVNTLHQMFLTDPRVEANIDRDTWDIAQRAFSHLERERKRDRAGFRGDREKREYYQRLRLYMRIRRLHNLQVSY